MQAIVVKILPVTEKLGMRVKATAAAGSVTLDYYMIEADNKPLFAAKALQYKFGWKYALVEGTLPNGDSVFVQL